MKDGIIPKDILYGKLTTGKRNLERPCYRDVCKRDKELSIDKNKWEELATDRFKWRSYLQATLKALEIKRRLRKEKNK